MPSLLAHFTNTLTSLKLYGGIDTTLVDPLVTALTTLSALTSLFLYGQSYTGMSLFEPVLSRLQAFACPSIDELCYHSLGFSVSGMHRLTSLALDLAFDVSLTISNHFFCSLTTFSPFPHSQTLDSSLFTNLAPCSRLSQVKLLHRTYFTPLDLPSKNETPLPGVKRLTLQMSFHPAASQFNCQRFCETLNVWLPSLTSFIFIIKRGLIPVMRAQLGQVPFAVEFLDSNNWSLDW